MDNHDTPPFPTEQISSARVFISYAHEDRQLHQELVKYLEPLERSGTIILWHDQEILPGGNWNDEIREHLATADVIVFLVSPDFLASPYCWDEEVKAALERHTTGEVRVVPILLRPAAWQDTPLRHLQLLPTGTLPVTQWRDQDAAFDDVVQGIRRTIAHLQRSHIYGKARARILWKSFINSAATRMKSIVTAPLSFSLISAFLLMGYGLIESLTLFGLMLPAWIRFFAPLLVLPFVIGLIRASTRPQNPLYERERRIFLALSAITIGSFVLGDVFQSMGQLTQLRMGFLPGAGDKDTNLINNDSFENDVRDQLKVAVSSQFFPSYTDTVQALAQGHIEMAWLGPFSYLYAVEHCHPRLLLSLLNEEGSSTYYSYIITKATSGVRSLADLRGKTFTIVDKLSTSGYLVPKYIFKKATIDIDQELTLKIGGSHPQVLQAVLNGTTPAGAISSTLYDEAIAQGQLEKGDIIILNADYTNYAIPSGPIVVRQDIQAYDTLRIEDAFLVVAANDPIALHTLNTKGFVKVTDSRYQMISDIAQELQLDPSQIP